MNILSAININDLLESLKVSGLGLLAVFLVIFIIMLLLFVINLFNLGIPRLIEKSKHKTKPKNKG